MLDIIITDGMSKDSAYARNPHMTSPWLLSFPSAGIGVLRQNPGGKRNRDGTRGGVWISGARKSHKPGIVGGTSRARRMYKGRKPVSDAPLEERIQSRRSRRRMAKMQMPSL
jgi:hypothetical protein